MDHHLTPQQMREVDAATRLSIQTGYENAKQAWITKVKWIIYEHALEHETFTVNDIKDKIVQVQEYTQDGRALGGVMKQAQKAKIIFPTGQKVNSIRGHKSQIEVWRSLIYRKERPYE